MRNASEGQPTRRLLAIALFVGAPALLAAFAVVNSFQIVDTGFAAAQMEQQLAAFNRRLDAPAADGKPVDVSRIYLGGASRTLASAELQQRVVSAVAATSGQLIETVSVDPTSLDGASEAGSVRIKATLDTDNHGLLQLLFVLESGVPLLDIETLSIRRLPGDTADGGKETLRIDMLVRAHWRPDNA